MANDSRNRMRFDEADARRLLLARAIETTSTQGGLLTVAEGEDLDLRAVKMARAAAGPRGEIDVGRALVDRAKLVLQEIENRNASLSALQRMRVWHSSVFQFAGLACFLMGLATDLVANQGRADLLSFPFIAIVAWNFAIYAYLFVSMFKRQPKPSEVQAGPIQWLHDRLHHKGWGGGKLRTEVIARFLEQWNRAASAVTALRIKQLLHICAAAWAAGLAASFLARAVTTQYWIGWESSLLNAEGLHWLLNVISIPISILLPVQPFTLAEVQAMGYASGGGSLADHASRWVYLYTGLLAIAVIIPRLLLAVFARWRANAAARRIVIDLSDPYFRRLVDQLRPANVMLWLCTHRPEDKTAFLGAIAHKLNLGVNGLLAETGAGDTLRLADIPASPPREETVSGWQGLLGGARLGAPAGSVADEDGDLILHVVSDAADLESMAPPLHEYGKNILILANPPADAGDNGLVVQCELHSRHRDRIKGVLAFDAFGRCWPQEPALLEAIGKCLGESGAEGFARLASTWKQRNLARFAKSMSALGYALLCAVREKEEVEAESFSLRDVFKANREARDRAREEAERRIAERLKPVYAGVLHDLLVLHGIDPAAAGTFEHAHEGGYEFRPTVNTTQAGTAGAVTGAALGMSVDAMSGGLTLGLGTLLGALLGGGLLGGGAGLMAAKWTNRKSASGAPIVQLSDEDLQKLLEGSLRLYLAVVHWGRPGSSGALDEAPAAWTSETVVAVEAHKARLATVFEASRERADSADSTAALAGECDSVARQVLSALYPDTRPGPA